MIWTRLRPLASRRTSSGTYGNTGLGFVPASSKQAIVTDAEAYRNLAMAWFYRRELYEPECRLGFNPMLNGASGREMRRSARIHNCQLTMTPALST